MLGVCIRTAQQWVENGLLEAWKTKGGHRRISLASVQRLRNAQGATEPETAANSKSSAQKDKLKVLVIEGNNILLRLYRLRLKSWHLPLEIITVSNPVDGLLLIGRETPDLLITDLSMPGVDGTAMVRTILQSPFREGMQIVIVTDAETDKLAELGGLPEELAVLPKPPSFSELRTVCDQLLQRRRELTLAMGL